VWSINKRAYLRVNDAIRAREVRLINFDGKQIGIVPIEEARRQAVEASLDLVEVAPDANPPVCKIIDYRKVLYEQKRKEREGRKRRRHMEIKEIKMRPTIDRHDLEIKMRHAREFIEVGHKVKITIQFRGREMSRSELGRGLLMRVAEGLADIAAVEDRVVQIGRQQHMILVPSAAKPTEDKPVEATPSGSTPNSV
jgi:translation initiation factor IF-3